MFFGQAFGLPSLASFFELAIALVTDRFTNPCQAIGRRDVADGAVKRYRIVLRLDARESYSIELAQLAANITRVPLTISLCQEESDQEFISRLPKLAQQAEFLRTVATPTESILRAVYEVGLNWINAPILGNGEIELTRWLREQSISESLHRYGQISERPGSPYP